MNITLHIEKLVLDGISLAPHERQALQASVEGELARLLLAGGITPDLRSASAVRSVRAADMHLAPDSGPVQKGTQIARAVYGGIGQ